jgi:hypothetical protein
MACCLPLCLLVIVAGMFLLAHTKKENLGNFYKYVALFVVIMGFLGILACAARCAMRCCRMGQHRMEMREYRMMDGDGGMMRHMGGCGMMGHRHMMMGGCCDGMRGCNEGMSQCNEGMMNGCSGDMNQCDMNKDGGSCPMMKGEMHEEMTMKKDSVKKK